MSDIHFSILNNCGLIVLDRPDSLNALSPSMLKLMIDTLTLWQTDENIQYILVRSSGGRSFCSGGDIRHIYESRQLSSPDFSYFALEYRLNYLIHTYPKPYISLIDGIVMGGGVGISFHGSHIIAGDNLLFAMPEVSIGFFPDVGSSYFLSRLPDSFGLYLGLTGARLRASEVLSIGLATHHCPSSDLESLERALCSPDAPIDPDVIISEFCVSSPSIFSHPDSSYVSFIFESSSSILDIFRSLESDSSDWSSSVLSSLRSYSPTSLFLAFRLISLASDLSIDECLRMDYRLAYRLLEGDEFYEGIRAAVIDKGSVPSWSPSDIESVDSSIIDSYFGSLGLNELDF